MDPTDISRRRTSARAFIAIGIACLVAQAFGVRVTHHSLWLTIAVIVPPVLAVLCGLDALRRVRGHQ